MYNLFLDDIRFPGDIFWIDIGDHKWEIVRSYDEAVDIITRMGWPRLISFDHDLGYEEYHTNESGTVIVTNAIEEKSGYDFCKYLIEYDLDTNTMPDDFEFTVHSQNPIGARSIQSALDKYIEYRRKK